MYGRSNKESSFPIDLIQAKTCATIHFFKWEGDLGSLDQMARYLGYDVGGGKLSQIFEYR